MPYTFWYSGILIGESEMEEGPDNRRQRSGTFQPTAYGLEIFPRLTGIFSAGHALKVHLDAIGLSPDTMNKAQVEQVIDSTPAGQKILDIGRALSDVEMRAPDGTKLEFESIGFTDLLELQQFGRELDPDPSEELAGLAPDAPRYLVSATLRGDPRDAVSEGRPRRRRRRRRFW